jgi:glutamyl-Q tRNA(Asp) synthetase
MSYVGRFAPSPTGPLHFGSLVAAVASFCDARAHGGRWLIRVEDVDETRCRAEFILPMLSTLERFGMTSDGPVWRQTDRTSRYDAALRALLDLDLAYACVCSRKEIADSALRGIEGPVYPGTCRRARHPLAGNAIRVLTDNVPIRFTDRVQGPVEQVLERDIGDFVIRRRDQLFAYQLAVVVDDADQGVTDVVRGADLIDSTPRQIHLQRALALPTPCYLHIPVVTNEAGQKLSKQTLAPDATVADTGTILRAALSHLGQDVSGLATTSSAPEILAVAIDRWTPDRIPARRHLPQVAPI